jgi:hypothetical protein
MKAVSVHIGCQQLVEMEKETGTLILTVIIVTTMHLTTKVVSTLMVTVLSTHHIFLTGTTRLTIIPMLHLK